MAATVISGEPDDEIPRLQESLGEAPTDPVRWRALGEALLRRGRFAEAELAWRGVVALAPNDPAGHFRVGLCLHSRGEPEAAIAHYRDALALSPEDPECLNNLGCALRDLRRPAEAVTYFQAAIRRRPNYGAALSNLGNAYKEIGRLDEAEDICRAATAAMPDSAFAHFNLGCVLQAQGRSGVAADSYRAALALAPDYVPAHCNLAEVLLRLGAMPEGWAEFEWRSRADKLWNALPQFPQPRWRGESLAGKTILLHCEQGFGDVLQFCRYAPLLAKRGGRVVVRVYPPLARLMKSLPGVAEVTETGTPLPKFDVHLPMLSVPHILRTRLETIPSTTPYLAAPEADRAVWRERLKDVEGLKVGLVWAGNPRPHDPDANRMDALRSLNLADFAPLAEVPGVALFSLQKGPPAEQAAAPPPGLALVDHSDELADFADTAALIENLDLVISVDTSVVHLAGALGKPVWVLSRFNGCWRWLENRDDSPWYPTARIFRQPRRGDWSETVLRVRDALRALARA